MQRRTGPGVSGLLGALAFWAIVAAPTLAAEPPPGGEYSVIAIRKAGDVAGGPTDASLAGTVTGSTIVLREALSWLFGNRCSDWSVSESAEPVVTVEDPILSDTQVTPARIDRTRPDHRVNRHLRLTCDGRQIGTFLQVDNQVLVVPSPSGASYVILERRIGQEAAERIENELKSMTFMSGPVTGRLGQNARRGAAHYARYLGAAFTFAGTPISENIAEAMALHDRLPEVVPAHGAPLELIKKIISGEVSAHFMGRPEPLAPPTYGVRELVFSFAGDAGRYPFRPADTLHFSDWYFDGLYSPGGRAVLLLHDRFGPYHVVRVENLKRYLKGEAGPDHVVGQAGGADRPPSVHGAARWLSPAAIAYTATCCGTVAQHVHHLAIPGRIGAPDGKPLAALRPGAISAPLAVPAATVSGLRVAFSAMAQLNAAARAQPGQWTEGHIALGADPEQYEPSDEEIRAAEFGDMLLGVLAGINPVVRAGLLAAPGIPGVLRYTRFDVRDVKVMGSGLFFYASAPQVVTVELR